MHDRDTAATTIEGPGRELVQHVHRELRQLARARLRGLPPGHSLQPTDLVHEAYLRLARHPGRIWKGRRHFYRAAAVAMRHLLIDRARSHKAMRNGGDWKRTDITSSLANHQNAMALSPEDLLTLSKALKAMQTAYPVETELVLMRYFCGLTMEQIARIMGESKSSVERRWAFARAWLGREIRGGSSA